MRSPKNYFIYSANRRIETSAPKSISGSRRHHHCSHFECLLRKLIVITLGMKSWDSAQSMCGKSQA